LSRNALTKPDRHRPTPGLPPPPGRATMVTVEIASTLVSIRRPDTFRYVTRARVGCLDLGVWGCSSGSCGRLRTRRCTAAVGGISGV
jgi:hypothetical protein